MKQSFILKILLFCCLVMFSGCQSYGPESISQEQLPRSIHIEYSWMGLSPTATQEVFNLQYDPEENVYVSKGVLAIVPVDQTQAKQTKSFNTRIPASQVQAILEAIHQDPWNPTDKPEEVIEHTDDYPKVMLEFMSGKPKDFKLTSTSNTATGTPWNLKIRKKLYSTKDTHVGTRIHEMLQHIRPTQ